MERPRLINLLLILLVLIAMLFLAQMVWQLVSGFADVFLLFLLGWLIAFILKPITTALSESPSPSLSREPSPDSSGSMKRAANFRFSRTTAVTIVYVLLLILLVAFVALFLPPTVQQLSALANDLPEYANRAPEASAWIQDRFEHLGVRINLDDTVRTAINSLQVYAATLIQNALGIFTGAVAFVANLFFVLILSFYFAVDEPRLRKGLLNIIPAGYHDEAHFFGQSVDRTFGGFIRGQLIMAILQGVGTAIAMMAFRLDFVLVASLFGGLFMLIPLVGGFLTLLPPLFVALFEAPNVALWLVVALFVYQFIVTNVLMPRLLSESIGMHPLLVFASLLIGIKVAGFWGAFFGIPVAGVLWAMGNFFYEGWQDGHTEAKKPD